ncbi:MAG: trypsin-like peptidase domain-containing protein [Patescibacteria group bacterium]
MINNKNIFIVLVSSLVTTVIIVAAATVVVATQRDRIFHYFASHYLTEELNRVLGNSREDSATTPNLFSQEALVVDAVAKATPAVVSIIITKDVPVIERYFDNFNPFGDLFGDTPLFNFGPFDFQVPRERSGGTERREVGGGTGFFVSAEGHIITNRHVVSDTTADYTAITADGKKHEVEVLAKDPLLDIAVLKVKGGGTFPYLQFDDSDEVKVGQTAIAIGYALGEFKNTVSVGVVSGLYRSITASSGLGESETLDEVIQTDAAINPGNSGGPLLDLRGRVVGVNVAVARGSENIGFALPANVVRGVVESVQKNNKIVRPYLGIRYVAVTPAMKEKNKLSVDYGALVLRGEKAEDLAVIPGSPADKAGIVENDIILELAGVKLEADKSLAALVRRHEVGETVAVKVWHKGQTKTLQIKLEAAPE